MGLNPSLARREMGRAKRPHQDRKDRLRKKVRKMTDQQLLKEAPQVMSEKDVLIYLAEMLSRDLIDTYRKRQSRISVRFTGKPRTKHFWPPAH